MHRSPPIYHFVSLIARCIRCRYRRGLLAMLCARPLGTEARQHGPADELLHREGIGNDGVEFPVSTITGSLPSRSPIYFSVNQIFKWPADPWSAESACASVAPLVYMPPQGSGVQHEMRKCGRDRAPGRSESLSGPTVVGMKLGNESSTPAGTCATPSNITERVSHWVSPEATATRRRQPARGPFGHRSGQLAFLCDVPPLRAP